MKTTITLILCLLFGNLFSQSNKKITVASKVNQVTVFLDGAQVFRDKSINLEKGKSVLRFKNLSPFIDVKSIQVATKGEITVLSVNHHKNYLKKSSKSEELKKLEDQIEAINDKIELENVHLSIIKENLTFLMVNRQVNSKKTALNVISFKQISEFYSNKVSTLKLKEIEQKRN